jgi:hypothetical protein
VTKIRRLNGMLETLSNGVTVSFKVGPSGPVGANAGGTSDWGGGLTWVGERGPELIQLPQHSKVYTHHESVQMMTSGPSGGGVHIEHFEQNVSTPIPLSLRDATPYAMRAAMTALGAY